VSFPALCEDNLFLQSWPKKKYSFYHFRAEGDTQATARSKGLEEHEERTSLLQPSCALPFVVKILQSALPLRLCGLSAVAACSVKRACEYLLIQSRKAGSERLRVPIPKEIPIHPPFADFRGRSKAHKKQRSPVAQTCGIKSVSQSCMRIHATPRVDLGSNRQPDQMRSGIAGHPPPAENPLSTTHREFHPEPCNSKHVDKFNS